MSEQKTVTVRIPVFVNQNGDWVSSHAGNTLTDKEMRSYAEEAASDCLMGFPQLRWITAEVPIPQPVEVPGKVEE